MLHRGPSDLLRRHLSHQLVFVNEGPKHGLQLVVKVPYMLEGFRKGRVVRLFAPGWLVKDPPYGQGLMNYGYRGPSNTEIQENTAKEYSSDLLARFHVTRRTFLIVEMARRGIEMPMSNTSSAS